MLAGSGRSLFSFEAIRFSRAPIFYLGCIREEDRLEQPENKGVTSGPYLLSDPEARRSLSFRFLISTEEAKNNCFPRRTGLLK